MLTEAGDGGENIVDRLCPFERLGIGVAVSDEVLHD
jgi:hypothetical protein